MKRTTIADVAKYAEVSKSTVSQYLNRRYDYMGEDTKKRIGLAIEQLGYKPNILARSLKQKSTMTIGVIVANILHVFSTQVIRAIEDFCNEKDFQVIICNADDNPIKEKKYIDMLRAKQVDGIIAFPTGGNLDLYKQLVLEKYPLVFMDRLVEGITVEAVLLDNMKASHLAVEEFARKGYEKIALVSPPVDNNITPRIERITGYKQAIQKYNLSFETEYFASGKITELQPLFRKIFELPEPPKAVLATNDRVLFEVLKFTKNQKIKIPQDLAVIGIDDVSFSSFYHPTLTTIAQPSFEMGKKAAELLLDRIANKDKELDSKIYRYEPEIIIRSSC